MIGNDLEHMHFHHSNASEQVSDPFLICRWCDKNSYEGELPKHCHHKELNARRGEHTTRDKAAAKTTTVKKSGHL